MTDYKSYQQIISLTSPKVTPVKKTEEKVKKITKTQKRTKTGCLTCRKRKKKCDENVVDGKCQGCTRNFLECNWAFHFNKSRTSSVSSETSMISDSLASESIASEASTNSEPGSRASTPFSSYPSPKSPKFDDVSDINHIKLPPLRFNQNLSNIVLPKIEFPKPAVKSKFIITSLSENRMCSLS